jgi:hypothetical protein
MPTLPPALVDDRRGIHDQRLAGRRVRTQCRHAGGQSRGHAQVPATSMQRGDLDCLLRRTCRFVDHTRIAIHLSSNSDRPSSNRGFDLPHADSATHPALERTGTAVDSGAAPASMRASTPQPRRVVRRVLPHLAGSPLPVPQPGFAAAPLSMKSRSPFVVWTGSSSPVADSDFSSRKDGSGFATHNHHPKALVVHGIHQLSPPLKVDGYAKVVVAVARDTRRHVWRADRATAITSQEWSVSH